MPFNDELVSLSPFLDEKNIIFGILPIFHAICVLRTRCAARVAPDVCGDPKHCFLVSLDQVDDRNAHSKLSSGHF